MYIHIYIYCSLAKVMFNSATPWTATRQASLFHHLPEFCSNSYPLSQWCHLIISGSVAPLSSCPQSFPASRFFPMSWLLASDGQTVEASASAPVLPMNIQDWLPLGWTVLVSLQSKKLSRVFSNTTVQKHRFLGAQLSLWPHSHILTWPLESHSFD